MPAAITLPVLLCTIVATRANTGLGHPSPLLTLTASTSAVVASTRATAALRRSVVPLGVSLSSPLGLDRFTEVF